MNNLKLVEKVLEDYEAAQSRLENKIKLAKEGLSWCLARAKEELDAGEDIKSYLSSINDKTRWLADAEIERISNAEIIRELKVAIRKSKQNV